MTGRCATWLIENPTLVFSCAKHYLLFRSVTKESLPNRVCLNCGAALSENAKYCSACGQSNKSTEVTLWWLISEFVTQQFALESRFFRSLITLFWRPGQLTLDYWQGKRARYLSPIQIYLIASVIFFLIVDVSATFSTNAPVQFEAPDWQREINRLDSDSISVGFGFKSYSLTKEQFIEFLESKPSELEAFFEKHDMELDAVAMYFARLSHQIMQPGGFKQFAENYLSLISQTVIILMPVFGLILYVLNYWRSKNSVLCILFSAHVHAFAYFVLIVLILIELLWPNELMPIIGPIGFIYFVIAQRRVFGGNWILIIIKSLVAAMMYTMCIVMFVILLAPIVGFTM